MILALLQSMEEIVRIPLSIFHSAFGLALCVLAAWPEDKPRRRNNSRQS